MSDEQAAVKTASDEGSMSAGALLRQARERAGLHIGALAVALKVPVKKLEALEADRHEQLPDAVFVRALAASVCRALKVDDAPILERLPQTAKSLWRVSEIGLNQPFQRPHQGGVGAAWRQLPRPALITVTVLLAGALAVLVWPEVTEQSSVSQPVTAPLAALPAPTPVTESATPVPLSPALPQPPVNEAPVAAPAAPAVTLQAATQLTATQAETQGHTLRFKTRAESWVEVTDRQGTVLLRRKLAAGETAGITAPLPLSVVVGRADATEVWVRGQPFVPVVVGGDNVARFEVK